MGWDDITCCPPGPRPLAPPAKPGAVSQSRSRDCIMNINKAQRPEIPGLSCATPQAPPTHPPPPLPRASVRRPSRLQPVPSSLPCCSDSDSEPGKGAWPGGPTVSPTGLSGFPRARPGVGGGASHGTGSDRFPLPRWATLIFPPQPRPRPRPPRGGVDGVARPGHPGSRGRDLSGTGFVSWDQGWGSWISNTPDSAPRPDR